MSGSDTARSPAELALLAQAGEASALEELANAELPLVKYVASRFAGRGTDTEDLIQIGCIGLIKAAKRFDPAHGAGFSTYAFTLIEGEIRRALRDGGLIKTGRRYRELAVRINRLVREAEQSGAPPPKASELAEKLNCSPSDICMASEALQPCISLDSLQSAAELGTEKEETGFERILVSSLIEKLCLREREVLRLRYYMDRTQTETAAVLGMSQAAVSRTERRALAALRAMLGEEDGA